MKDLDDDKPAGHLTLMGQRGLRPAGHPIAPARLANVSAPAACNDNAGVLHLAELVPVVRQRLKIEGDFPDDMILASLRAIAAKTSDRDRWRAAFNSRLALWLSTKGRELGGALQLLIALLPPPRS